MEVDRERARLRSKRWYRDNISRAKKNSKICSSRAGNKERKKEWQKNRLTLPEPRYRWMVSQSRGRKIAWELSFDQFFLLWGKPCEYCGDGIATVGIDRIDSSFGYVEGNVVPCCLGCNYAKLDYSQEDFIARCIRVADRFRRRI